MELGSQSDQFKQQLKILASMYVGYGAMMVCRQMVTILSPAMLADESLGLTKTQIGDFLAYGTIGALIGKLIWGPLADRIGGRKTFLIGILFTAALVALFGTSFNVMAFTIFSFLLYGTKSSGWPGMAKLIGNWYHPSQYGRVWGVLSTSSRASVVLGTLFFGWMLSFMNWRWVALSAGLIALMVFAACFLFLSEKPEDPQFLKTAKKLTNDPEKTKELERALENKKNHPFSGTSLAQGLIEFSKNSRVWLIVIMLMLLTCLMAFLDFLPMFLMEVFHLTPSKASMASSVFPVGSLLGLVCSVFFYDRFSKNNLRKILTLMLGIATLCIFCLFWLPNLGLNPDQNFMIALISVFVFGFMISPAYYIPMSVFSVEFGGPHCATLICLIDAFGFLASATFLFVGGRFSDGDGGWMSFMYLLIVLSGLTTASVWLFMSAEYRATNLSGGLKGNYC